MYVESWCSVQVSFVVIKQNINFSGKDFLKAKVVACFYTILLNFGKLTASLSFIGCSMALLSFVQFLTALTGL